MLTGGNLLISDSSSKSPLFHLCASERLSVCDFKTARVGTIPSNNSSSVRHILPLTLHSLHCLRLKTIHCWTPNITVWNLQTFAILCAGVTDTLLKKFDRGLYENCLPWSVWEWESRCVEGDGYSVGMCEKIVKRWMLSTVFLLQVL